MKIREILTDVSIPEKIEDLSVSSLTASAREIREGSLFFLTEGVRFENVRQESGLPIRMNADGDAEDWFDY